MSIPRLPAGLPGLPGLPLSQCVSNCYFLPPPPASSLARNQVTHDPELSLPLLVGIAALNAVGYAIFRGANSQKDAFRRDPMAPEVAHLKFMNTKRG